MLHRVRPPSKHHQGRQGLINRPRPEEGIEVTAPLARLVLAEEQCAVDEPCEAGLGPRIEKASAPIPVCTLRAIWPGEGRGRANGRWAERGEKTLVLKEDPLDG
jgi:hypothetical protein